MIISEEFIKGFILKEKPCNPMDEGASIQLKKEMKSKLIVALLALAAFFNQSIMAEDTVSSGPVVDIKTTMGDIKVKLYDDTPAHRDNFLKLVNDGFYNGVLFHRVIKDFMIQTGDPDSKNAGPEARLGSGSTGYTLEAEILYPKHFHKYGALAAARTGDNVNPERRSSGSQFYIVTGNKYSESDVDMMARQSAGAKLQDYFNSLVRKNADKIRELQAAGDREGLEALRQQLIKETEANVSVEMPSEIVKAYTTVGGTPHLDGQYTVFGEVLEGMDVVEKIQNAATGRDDRPVEDIRVISMEVEK